MFGSCFESHNDSIMKNSKDSHAPILPGLPDELSKQCLALLPRSNLPVLGAVCKQWRSFIKSKEFMTIRKLSGNVEEWLYILTKDEERVRWEVIDGFGVHQRQIPTMPGPVKAGFGVAVLNGKLFVSGGYSTVDRIQLVSPDVYEYDSCLNSWTKLASMNMARYDFACAELNGHVYVFGGCGQGGQFLSSVEIYDPDTDKWTESHSLPRPRWGSFAYGFMQKLYIMGGRSAYTIGNSKFIDVYSPETRSWCQIKNGCVMVTAYAVLGKKLCCLEWKNERELVIFDPADSSLKKVGVPVVGSGSIGFKFGVLNGKLLLLSSQDQDTLLYDPNASPGHEWLVSAFRPTGLCSHSVTIRI